MNKEHIFLIDTFNDVLNDYNIYFDKENETEDLISFNVVITTQTLSKLCNINHDIFRYYGAAKTKTYVYPFVLNVVFKEKEIVLTTDVVPILSMTELELFNIINTYNENLDYIKCIYTSEGLILTSAISLNIFSLQTGEKIRYTFHELLDLIINRVSEISYEYYYLFFQQRDLLADFRKHL